jgi:hypothetical protein
VVLKTTEALRKKAHSRSGGNVALPRGPFKAADIRY